MSPHSTGLKELRENMVVKNEGLANDNLIEWVVKRP